jgi:HK97 family phage prohead protease
MERKSFPFELEEKGLDPEARTFQGFAAVMGNIDEGGDMIERGAFKKTIEEMGERVKVYFIHDFMQPIGKVLEMKELPKSRLPITVLNRAPDATGGLWVKGYVSNTNLGNDALTLMRDTVLDELSIGFNAVREQWDEAHEIRTLKEIKLMDISPVPLAMNPAAIVTDVKKMIDIDELPIWDDEKPYPNEHACRLRDPDQYDTCRRGQRESDGKKFYVIYCKKGDGPMEEQAYRYPKDTWTVAEARAHCGEHDGSFEAAQEEDSGVIKGLIQQAEFQRREIEAKLDK